jgi:hypothetical protein
MSIFDFGPRRKKSSFDPIGLGIDDMADSAPPASKRADDCIVCGIAMFGNQSNLCSRCRERRDMEMFSYKIKPGEMKPLPTTGDPYLDAAKRKEAQYRDMEKEKKKHEIEQLMQLFEALEKQKASIVNPPASDPVLGLKKKIMEQEIRDKLYGPNQSQYPGMVGVGSTTQQTQIQVKPTRVAPVGDGFTQGSVGKLLEESASFGETPFSQDSVASDIFYHTGYKPACIFMSATSGHTLEVFELAGHVWLRQVDEQNNLMQIRLDKSERQRLKDIL